MVFVRSKTDRRFARFCRTGDPDALADVFDATAARLLRVALWLCRHRADAEDLVQRAFLQAIALREQFEPGRKVLPWLLGLLSNQAHRLRREQQRLAATAAVPVVERVVDPEAEVVALELRDAVRAVRANLSEPYRDVLELHLEQGLDAGEIAQRLGRPAGTVRTQLMRALEMLRKKLPSGFVAGFAPVAMGGPGGLGAVRIAVVEAARSCVPVAMSITAAVAKTGIGGVVVAKKLLVIVPVVAVLLGVAVLQPWSQDSKASPPAAMPLAANLDAGKAPNDAVAKAPDPEPQRQIAASPVGKPRVSAQSLEVEVFDNHEQPVEGALVVLSKEGVEELTEHSQPAAPAGITDASGRVRLADVAETLPFVGAVKPGQGASGFLRRFARSQLRLRLYVVDCTLRGRVIEHGGSGVPGAAVELSRFQTFGGGPDAVGNSSEYVSIRRQVTTDAEGWFAIEVCRDWKACRLVAHKGMRWGRGVMVHLDDVGENQDIRLEMPGRVRVHGTVSDWRGRPAPDCNVGASQQQAGAKGDAFSQWSRSDGAGHFDIALYAPGLYWIGSTGNTTEPWSETRSVRLQDGTDNEVSLQLAEPARIDGILIGMSRAERTTVRAFQLREGGSAREAEVDDRGHFALAGLMRGEEYGIAAFQGDRQLVIANAIAGSGKVVELCNPAGNGSVAVVLAGTAVASLPAANRRSVCLVEVEPAGKLGETIGEQTPVDDGGLVFEHPRTVPAAIAILLVDGEERARSGVFAIGNSRTAATIEVPELGVVELEPVAQVPAGSMVFAQLLHADGLPFLRGSGGRLVPGKARRWTVSAADYLLRVTRQDAEGHLDVTDLPCRVAAGATTRLRAP